MTTDSITSPGLYRLMTWLSPSFPVGAFAYSHGLEYAVESGAVRDGETLTRWIEGVIRFGAGRVDASLFRTAYEAADARDFERLEQIVERGQAQRGTAEMALESSAQGRAFLDTLSRVWKNDLLRLWHLKLENNGDEPAYCIAVGVACALAEIPVAPALSAYLNAFAGNLVSAGVRLVPLGQTDGQRAMVALEAPIISAAHAALRRAPEDFGAAAVTVDWMSMQHETQYTRLFRS